MSVGFLCFAGPPSCQRHFFKPTCEVRITVSHVHLDVPRFRILVRTFSAYHGAAVKHTPRPLINPFTRSGIKRETPLADSHPHLTSMTDTNTDTLQQLQNHIAEMERRHEEELTKLKANQNQLEDRVRRSQGDEESAHTLLERTQGESHAIMDCPSTSFCRPHYGGRCTLGVETTQPQAVRWDNRSKRVSDNFLTQANLYTNDDAILCLVFPTSLKGATLTWYGGLPPRSINSFDTLVKRFSAQYATSRSHRRR